MPHVDPSEHLLEQILRIHTADMRVHGRMTQAAIDHLPYVVEATKNFTGAELAGLVRSAASFSLAKNIDAKEVCLGLY